MRHIVSKKYRKGEFAWFGPPTENLIAPVRQNEHYGANWMIESLPQ